MELQPIQSKIYEIRGQRVMLDFDLAELYQVETRTLKQAVRRNIERFEGDDFMFELSDNEYNALKDRIRSQNVILEIDGRGKYPKYPPFAFTEMGVAMLSSVLRSETAIRVNRAIMRAFVAMRNYIMTTTTVTAELAEIRARLALLEQTGKDNAEAVSDLSEDMRQELDNIYEAIAALKAHYARCGIAVDDVTLIPGTPGYYKTDYTITKPGRVSVLIPSCDHSGDLRVCVESIYRKTTYPDFELILIENNSKQPETFRAYERMQKEHPDNLKVVTWEGKGFNYSALNNFGAKEATGEYLLLLNNDTEVISPRWIEEMLMYAQQDRVGCVGAKLLYPDNTIQHAGIGFGFLTLAAHMHKNFPVGHPGYMGRLVYAQDVYAVTAACLMVRRSVYEQVNGLDESFAVAFNDVDFCVRVREAGYTNVFTPFAQLYHYESKSRGLDENPVKRKRFISEVERFQKRWAKQLAAGDPCMNPNFDLMKEDFSFDIKPLE